MSLVQLRSAEREIVDLDLLKLFKATEVKFGIFDFAIPLDS